jgi:hypothetical protein
MGFSPEVFKLCVCIENIELSTLLTRLHNPPQVDHFQPFYTFNKKHMTELRIGAAILREAMQTAEKDDDEGLKVRTAKAEEELRKQRVRVISFSLFSVIFVSSGNNSIFFLRL